MRKPITIIVDLQEVENLEVSCHSEYCGDARLVVLYYCFSTDPYEFL